MVATAAANRAAPGVQVGLSAKQAAFRRSAAPFRGFVAGRGSGKSFVGAIDMCKRALAGRHYVCVAESYRMLADTSFRTFQEVSTNLGVYHDISKKDFTVFIRTYDGGIASVLFRSAHDPETLRGPNLSGAWLEEASLMKQEAFDIVIASLREGGDMGWMSMTFTPKGKTHWTYPTFFDADGNPNPDTFLVQAHTKENPFIDERFYKTIERKYTTRMQAQELAGQFIDIEGIIVRREWFASTMVERAPEVARRVRYWDKAGTQDDGCFTVGLLMALAEDGHVYIEDVVRGQWSAFERQKNIHMTAQLDALKYANSVNILAEQEPGSSGKDVILYMARDLMGFPFWGHSPSGDKITRIQPFAAYAEQGLVHLCTDGGNWIDDWLDELTAAPETTYWDQIDATSGAFGYLTGQGGGRITGDLLVWPAPEVPAGSIRNPVESDLLTFLQKRYGRHIDHAA